MTQRTKHVQIPATRAANIEQQRFNDAVRQQLNMLGGTKLDRVLTVRDVQGGVLKGIKLAGAVIDVSAQPGSGGGADADAPTVPTNVQGFAGVDVTFLTWDRPTFRGYAYTEIFRFDADSLALAQRVATSTQPAFSEYVGYGQVLYYWVRHVSTAGSASAFHATAGLKLETKPDYEAIQDALSEQINESYLAQTLRARIDLIDVSNNGGLVAAQQQLSAALTDADTRLTAADETLSLELNNAKLLLQDQIDSQGVTIVSLQNVDAQQAQILNALTFRMDDAESTILQLDTVTDNHASRLTSIESVNTTQGSSISSLQTTTSSHATSISRLGAYDTAANKYAFIKTLEQADASQVSRIGTLEADNTSNKSRITSVESVNATQASKLTALETDNTTNKNKIATLETTTSSHASRLTSVESVNSTQAGKITTLESTTAGHATRLGTLEADNGTSKSRLTSLETADATQASRIEQLSFSLGDSMAVSDTTAFSTTYVGKVVPSLSGGNVTMVAGKIRAVGTQSLYTVTPFKVDTSRKYRVRFVVRQTVDFTVGDSRVYAGVATIDGDYNAITGGAGSHRYCAASGVLVTAAQGRQIFEGIITGEGALHNQFRPGTVYVRPMLIVNYLNGNGTAEIESLEIRDITDVAAVEDTARAYTDTKTGEIRAERTIKVQSDGRVAGIGLIAGATSGSALYFTADKIAILPPGANNTTGARLPFIYDAATGAIMMDTTFIRDLTASQIAGGVLNLTQGNIRNLTVFESFSPPDQFLQKTHVSDDLARQLAWVDPNAVMTGGSVKKTVSAHVTTTVIGSFLSGGQVPSIKVSGSGPVVLYSTMINGYIDVQVLRNNVPMVVNGQDIFRLTITSAIANDETLPNSQRLHEVYVTGGVEGVAAAVASNTTTEYKVRIVTSSGINGKEADYLVSATVIESFGSSGGLIANTTWAAIADKPATATRWPTPAEVGALPSVGGTLTGQVTYDAGAVQSISERWHVNGQLRWAMGREADGNQFNLWHYSTSGAYVRAFSFNGSNGNLTAANFVGLWYGYGFATTATVNTMALRDSAADISARLFRSNYQNESSIASTAAMAFRNDTTDNYIRFCNSPAAIRNWLDAPSRSGANASGTWGISISGTAAAANLLAYAPSINRTAFNGSANVEVTEWFHSHRDFASGTLVTTSINYANSSGDPWVLEITGNSYSTSESFDLKAHGYIYADTIINIGGQINGYDMPGIIALNIGGNLCFWWPRYGYWQGFNVRVYRAHSAANENRVVSVTNSADPGGTKRVTISDKLRAKPVPTSMLSQAGGAGKVAQYDASGYLNVLNWVKLATNTGVFYDNNTHLYSPANGYLRIRGTTTATQIALATDTDITRGYVYATVNNDVGFLNNTGGWVLRCNGTTVNVDALTASGNVIANRVYSGDWFRSSGATGWYNETYGGGIHMTDAEWVRVYNAKKFYVGSVAVNAITSGGGISGKQLGVWDTTGTGNGVSLYGGPTIGQPTWGLMFARTANFGTHGSVNADWATYLTMAGSTGRGWVFRHESNNVASISAAGNLQLNGTIHVEGNYKVLSYKDFVPNMPPPAGLENTITASWLSAGVVTANIIASGGINVVDGGNKVLIHPKATTPIRFEKDGVETFSVNIDGTGYFAGNLAKDTVNTEAIQDEAKKAINPRYLGGGERKTLGASLIAPSAAAMLPTFTTLKTGDKVSISARFAGGDDWSDRDGTADPAWTNASYTLQIQRSINNATFANVGAAVSLAVNVSVSNGPDEPLMRSYAYNRSVSFTDVLTTTSANIRYRVLVTRTSGGTTGPGAGLFLASMSGERSAFDLNEIRGSSGGPRQFIDKDSGFSIITGEISVPTDSSVIVSFPTALAEVFSSFAQGVFASYGEYSNGAAEASLSAVAIYNQLSTRVIKYTVHGRVNV